MSLTSEILAPPLISAPARGIPKALLLGVAASSCGAYVLELALTRLFSVVLFYHFAFLAISIALLGLGSGGVFAYLLKQWLHSLRDPQIACCALRRECLGGSRRFWKLCLHLGVSLEFSRGNFARLTAIYLCSAVPFFSYWS